jgi:hypothetical protein
MMRAILPFVGFFIGSALAARYLIAWQWPFFLTMPFPKQLDRDAIYNRMKHRVFTKAWIASTLIAASMFAGGWISGNDWAFIYLMLVAIAIATFVSGAVTYKLFYSAVAELGLTYPPPSDDLC